MGMVFNPNDQRQKSDKGHVALPCNVIFSLGELNPQKTSPLGCFPAIIEVVA
jgi:hypothetical protein